MGGNERMVKGSNQNGGGELEDCGRIKRKREGTKEWWEDLQNARVNERMEEVFKENGRE